jgi:hypothetical protein
MSPSMSPEVPPSKSPTKAPVITEGKKRTFLLGKILNFMKLVIEFLKQNLLIKFFQIYMLKLKVIQNCMLVDIYKVMFMNLQH